MDPIEARIKAREENRGAERNRKVTNIDPRPPNPQTVTVPTECERTLRGEKGTTRCCSPGWPDGCGVGDASGEKDKTSPAKGDCDGKYRRGRDVSWGLQGGR